MPDDDLDTDFNEIRFFHLLPKQGGLARWPNVLLVPLTVEEAWRVVENLQYQLKNGRKPLLELQGKLGDPVEPDSVEVVVEGGPS